LAETSVGKDDNSTILALEMGNNLYKINPEKGINFLKAENINATLDRAGELKKVGDWWLAAQYLAAGITAQKSIANN
ncbi:MAG TPA: hypothetical protein DEA87_00510, partial [Candidatus Veblenbacteria bacterium]|nr:hypothetical protein [Candidatus Veblenbacteria bacterium]